MIRYLFFIFILIGMAPSCVEIPKPYTALPPGIWRAELDLGDEVTLPFNFEISYGDGDGLVVELINATERIKVTETSFGRTKDLRDTLIFNFPIFDSFIKAEYKENVIEGYWQVNYREDYKIPFVAFHGQRHRFTTSKEKPALDLTGRWAASFEIETEEAYPAIGEFVQDENLLTGTFLTETGDYRYLEGTVQGNDFALSCFDGSHAFLFTGKILPSGGLSGKFYSGIHYNTNWVATKNDSAELTDPYKLSQITTPDKKIDFRLPNTEGEMISLSDPQYDGKPKLITIMGTWCPNCLDESKFLLEYFKKNPEKDIEIIALAFEKYRDKDIALQIIKYYKDKLKIPYEILLAGYYDKTEATSGLGFIDQIISYPTLLFVNSENEVQKVHTGFAGPATSKYQEFKDRFDSDLDLILSSKR